MVTRSQPPARWVLLLGMTIVVLYLCARVLIPFLSVLLWAGVLAVVFYPTYRRVLARTPNRPNLAAFYMTTLVVFFIILPLVGVSLAVSNELQTTLPQAPEQISKLVEDPPRSLAAPVENTLEFIESRFGVRQADIDSQIRRWGTRLSTTLVQSTLTLVGSLIETLVAIAMAVFTLFFLFRDGEVIVNSAREMIPLDRMRSQALLTRVQDLILASVYGIVVLGVIQGVLGGIMFWALGLPSPLLWTVVMSVMATIPLLGTFVVWIPAAIYLAVTGSFGKALILAVWGTVVIGMSDNLLRPKLVGERASMHELLVFFSVLGGLDAFGMLGVLMGPVLVALGVALLAAFRATDHPDLLAVDSESGPELVASR